MIPSSSKNSDRIINELGGIGNSMSGHRFQSEGWSFAMDSRVRGNDRRKGARDVGGILVLAKPIRAEILMIRAMIFDLDRALVQTEKLKALSYAKAAVELCPYTLREEEVIEDSLSGVQAALSAGMHVVAVATPFTEQSLRESRAFSDHKPKALYVDDPNQVAAAVARIVDLHRGE